MHNRRTVLAALAIPVATACDGAGNFGGDARPQSERNLYSWQLQELQQAPTTITEGAFSLRTLVSERTFFQPDTPFWRVNPITGNVEIEQRPGGAPFRSWLLVAAIVDGSGSPVVTAWRPQTIWIVRGDDYVSSRNLIGPTDAAFGVIFPEPPFSRDRTVVVVEFVRGTEASLIASTPVWSD